MRVLRFVGLEDFIRSSPSSYKNSLFFLLHYMHGPCVVPKPAAKRFSGVGDGSLPPWGLVRKLRLERSVLVKITVKK
ncbi:hypothetical protein ACN38_g1473 [Penicillium nordicum]|uniref:Uncharacterized protein n=1 Tax=Penicillium nordicum TaxID=229535 RepID=A0A0M9WJP7_9EURO|nr:hypothetical protein ACN38_g1473 [Penicillium nordicum]